MTKRMRSDLVHGHLINAVIAGFTVSAFFVVPISDVWGFTILVGAVWLTVYSLSRAIELAADWAWDWAFDDAATEQPSWSDNMALWTVRTIERLGTPPTVAVQDPSRVTVLPPPAYESDRPGRARGDR